MLEINKVYNMDCIDGLKHIPDNSIDLIVTDPPYGINYISNYYKDKNPHKKIANDDTLFIPLEELWRVLKPTGAMFIFFSHKVPLIDNRLKNTIIWVKNNWTAGDLNCDFGNQYECIGFLPKDGFKIRGKRWSNVWNFDRISHDKLKHPTQKPSSIIRRIINCASDQGMIILDPFMGSGTTAVVSKELNRKYIGFEIEEDYFKVIEERLSQSVLFSLSQKLNGGNGIISTNK